MIEDLVDMFNYFPARLKCIEVHRFIRIVRSPADETQGRQFRDELKGLLANVDEFMGVCDSSGDLKLVFRIDEYRKWAREMRALGYTPEGAAPGFAGKIVHNPGLVLQKREQLAA